MVFVGVADFQDQEFTDKADFTSVTFQVTANFQNAVFKDGVDFRLSTFKQNVQFDQTIFEKKARIDEARFESQAIFRKATFRKRPSFNGAIFTGEVDFSETTFVDGAAFAHIYRLSLGGEHTGSTKSVTQFEGETVFKGAIFEGRTTFWGTQFTGQASFNQTMFAAEVQFGDCRFAANADFSNARFVQGARFSHGTSFAEKAVFKQSAFEGDVWFVGENIEARIFSGCEVVFEEVTYNSPSTIRFRYADLGRCRFLGTDLRRVDFMGVRWCERVGSSEWFNRQGLFEEIATEDRRGNPWRDNRAGKEKFADGATDEPEVRPWPEIERLYRELKVNYENRGDYPRAGDFHIGEKEARRQYESRCGMKVLLFLYRALSKYGERATPAALWLTGVVLVSLLSYVFLGATPQGSTDSLAFSSPAGWGEALQISLNATFFPIEPAGFESFWPNLINIIQRILSPILIALLALALRQRVRR